MFILPSNSCSLSMKQKVWTPKLDKLVDITITIDITCAKWKYFDQKRVYCSLEIFPPSQKYLTAAKIRGKLLKSQTELYSCLFLFSRCDRWDAGLLFDTVSGVASPDGCSIHGTDNSYFSKHVHQVNIFTHHCQFHYMYSQQYCTLFRLMENTKKVSVTLMHFFHTAGNN